MSHFTVVQTKFRDVEALVAALCEVPARGGECWTRDQVEVHADPQPLVGYDGSYRDRTDPTLNRHTRDPDRAVRAEVVVRRQHVGVSANDVGFRRGADGYYEAVVSGYDRGYYTTAREPGTWLSRVAQRYAVNVTKAEAGKRGYRVEETAKDGRVELQLVRAW